MARGDILFFHEDDAVSRLIQWWTAGPFNHVAVDMGDGTCIGALTRGVSRTVDKTPTLVVQLPQGTESTRLEEALTWLIEQEKSAYSWADIVNAVFPKWLPVVFSLREHRAYDCSDLVAQYLDRVGALPLSELGGDASSVTPNQLYRALFIRRWTMYESNHPNLSH